MEDVEDARHNLCREERIASERKEVGMAMGRMSPKHFLPDISQPFLDGSLRNLAVPLIGFSLGSLVLCARHDDGESAGLKGGFARAPLNFSA